jgi:hypothetical protein
MCKRIILSIAIIIALVVFGYAYIPVYKSNCNRVIFAVMLAENKSHVFDEKKEFKYEYLSSHMKKYIDRNTFENITSWEQASSIFNKVPERSYKFLKFRDWHDLKDYYYNNKHYLVYYHVYFTYNLLGCKVDKIKLEVGPYPD